MLGPVGQEEIELGPVAQAGIAGVQQDGTQGAPQTAAARFARQQHVVAALFQFQGQALAA